MIYLGHLGPTHVAHGSLLMKTDKNLYFPAPCEERMVP